MKKTPLQRQRLTLAAAMLVVCLCYGCASASTSSKPLPAEVFTQAAETAIARETIMALTPAPATFTAIPTLSEDGAPVIPQATLDAFMQGTTNAPADQPSAAPTNANSSAPGAPTATQAGSAPSPTAALQYTPTPAVSTNNQGAACIPASTAQTGKVLDILDGDTIKVMIDGKTYIVRYIGIDAPEFIKAKDFYGAEAMQKNSELVFAKDITLVKDGAETDASGRLLRYVKVGETFVNLELVKLGFAKAAPSVPPSACDGVFQSAQDQASAGKTGLWSKP